MDEDDLIVVDDGDDDYVAGPSTQRSTSSQPVTASGRMSTRRRSTAASTSYADPSDRTTRSSAKFKGQPKLKLKLSDKAAAQAPGMSFLGPYDRELDSDDEDLTFEEQFILRMPHGEDCERLRRMVATREIGPDVWFKFKDSRRAVFHVGNSTYSSKLVDLPCIIESQKTLDNKQMFKVADICQMLVVEDRIHNEDAINNQRSFNVDEFIWPHGITPPLHQVRKRRFRKRANKRTIESVEQEVERLLEADSMAGEVRYDVLENVNPDLSDSEYIENDGREHGFDPMTPGYLGSDLGDAPTPAAERDGDQDGDEDDEDEGGGDGDIDEELAAELDLALGDEGEEDEDEEEDDDDDSDDEDEDEDDEETNQARKLLNEEIRDLEAAVAKKNHEITSSANPLIRKRFEDALKKLRADLDMKLEQREEMKEQQRLQQDAIAQEPSDGAQDDEDLFGGEDMP